MINLSFGFSFPDSVVNTVDAVRLRDRALDLSARVIGLSYCRPCRLFRRSSEQDPRSRDSGCERRIAPQAMYRVDLRSCHTSECADAYSYRRQSYLGLSLYCRPDTGGLTCRLLRV